MLLKCPLFVSLGEINVEKSEWSKYGIPELLYHGSEANFDQFENQQNTRIGISGIKFGIYLTNDRNLAMDFTQNKYLYEIKSDFLYERALQTESVSLTQQDVSHMVEEMVKNEIQEEEVSGFLSNHFGDVPELSETETWNDLYTDLTNAYAEDMLDRVSNDVQIANELYISFGGKYSNAASDLGKALKTIGVTHCVQTRRYENERAINEIVALQPNELIIHNKIDISKEQQMDGLQNDRIKDKKQATPIVISTKNIQKHNMHVMEEQLER